MSIVKEGGVLVVLHYSRKEVWRWSIVEASLTLSGRESSGALRAWTELTLSVQSSEASHPEAVNGVM